jgi:hypothetical protein
MGGEHSAQWYAEWCGDPATAGRSLEYFLWSCSVWHTRSCCGGTACGPFKSVLVDVAVHLEDTPTRQIFSPCEGRRGHYGDSVKAMAVH